MSNKILLAGSCLVIALLALFAWKFLPKKSSRIETSSAVPDSPNSPTVTASKSSTPDAMSQKIDEIVARYRKTIILLEAEDPLPQADRDRASLIGKIIFQENHRAISELSNALTEEIEKAGDFSKPLPQVGRFLDLVETEQDLHDADKLTFREVFADLAESLAATKSSAASKTELGNRVDEDRKALGEIQSLYEKELDKIFGRFETRGMPVRREAWERYVAYLRTKYKREEIMKTYE